MELDKIGKELLSAEELKFKQKCLVETRRIVNQVTELIIPTDIPVDISFAHSNTLQSVRFFEWRNSS